jgi:Fe-S cluster assembly protein SufB
MIHLGSNTKSIIVSKGISTGNSSNSYRGIVSASAEAKKSRNYSQCDSLLIGKNCAANTYPIINVKNSSSTIEHEATTSKISEDVIFYLNQRGISTEDAISLIIHGYAKEVLQNLPMEFAVEAKQLLSISLEGSVG